MRIRIRRCGAKLALTGVTAAARIDLDAVRGATLDGRGDAVRITGVDERDGLPRETMKLI